MKTYQYLLSLVTAASILTCNGLAQTPPAAETPAAKPDADNLRRFVELARSELKTQKAVIIAENLPLTADEAAEFWPLHREYETELSKLGDLKLALVERFAKSFETLTDKQAGELAKESFDLETKRTELKRKYFKAFAAVIPATKAARFFQIENQINLVLDLQVAAALPLIK